MSYDSVILADSPIGYWKLNETSGSTLADSSSSGHTLTLNGSPTLGSTAIAPGLGTSMTCVESSSQYASASVVSNQSAPFSVEAWVSPTNIAGGSGDYGVFSSRAPSDTSYDMQITTPSGSNFTSFHNDLGTGASWLNTAADATVSIANSSVNHLVCTVSATTYVLYLNGAQVATGSVSGTTLLWGTSHNIFVASSGVGDYFTGRISNVAAYDTALTSTQVAAHYSAGTQSTSPVPMPGFLFLNSADPTLFQNLMGQYDFSSNVADSSGTGNTGTINGTVTAATDRRGTSSAAYTFDGSSGYITTSVSYNQPQVYSINAWFKTSSAAGGEMVGFANTQGPTPTHYDRHLAMDSAGHVIFGAYDNASTQVITSTSTYNDNAWHMATATMSATTGMTLYVDGVSVGTNANTISEYFVGWWIMGYNNFSAWPFTANNYYAGTLDDIKIYSVTLTSTQVSELYAL